MQQKAIQNTKSFGSFYLTMLGNNVEFYYEKNLLVGGINTMSEIDLSWLKKSMDLEFEKYFIHDNNNKQTEIVENKKGEIKVTVQNAMDTIAKLPTESRAAVYCFICNKIDLLNFKTSSRDWSKEVEGLEFDMSYFKKLKIMDEKKLKSPEVCMYVCWSLLQREICLEVYLENKNIHKMNQKHFVDVLMIENNQDIASIYKKPLSRKDPFSIFSMIPKKFLETTLSQNLYANIQEILIARN